MVIRLLPYLRPIVELLGLAAIVAAAFAFHPIAGLVALGVALMLAANFGGRPPLRPPEPGP